MGQLTDNSEKKLIFFIFKVLRFYSVFDTIQIIIISNSKEELIMKKTVFIIALVTALALVAGCKSKPPPPDPSLSDVEKTFYYLYHRFSNDLILEGAKEHTVVSGDTLARLAQAE